MLFQILFHVNLIHLGKKIKGVALQNFLFSDCCIRILTNLF